MNFNELVNKTVFFGTREQILKSVKSWIAKDYTLYVTDGEAYGEHIEKLYESSSFRPAGKLIVDNLEKVHMDINSRDFALLH